MVLNSILPEDDKVAEEEVEETKEEKFADDLALEEDENKA